MDEADLIDVVLDGRSYSVPGQTTLAALVESLGHRQDKVTTAVNGLHVRRDARAGCLLQPGDAVLLFQPITGG
jgi:sulfur carrier protein